MPDVMVCQANYVVESEMNSDFQGELVNKKSADVGGENNDDKTADVINVENIPSFENFFNHGIDEIKIDQMPDVMVCGVTDVIGSEMNVECQCENINETSADIPGTNVENSTADVIDVEKIRSVYKCFNGGIEDISDEIIIGWMSDVFVCGVNNVLGSEMNVEFQGKNMDKKSAEI